MLQKSHKLKHLRNAIAKSFKGRESPGVSLLPEGQVLISKNMIPNPVAELGGKSETFVPRIEGYEIYVAYRDRSDYVSRVTTAQRAPSLGVKPIPWTADSATLFVDRESFNKDWHILNYQGRVVSVTVDCGSEKMIDEINVILARVAEILLDDPLKGG